MATSNSLGNRIVNEGPITLACIFAALGDDPNVDQTFVLDVSASSAVAVADPGDIGDEDEPATIEVEVEIAVDDDQDDELEDDDKDEGGCFIQFIVGDPDEDEDEDEGEPEALIDPTHEKDELARVAFRVATAWRFAVGHAKPNRDDIGDRVDAVFETKGGFKDVLIRIAAGRDEDKVDFGSKTVDATDDVNDDEDLYLRMLGVAEELTEFGFKAKVHVNTERFAVIHIESIARNGKPFPVVGLAYVVDVE